MTTKSLQYEQEIEIKTLIPVATYNSLLKHYFHDTVPIFQENAYFDQNNLLKNNNAALRIRTTKNKNTLTLKIKSNTYKSLEFHDHQFESINNKTIDIHQISNLDLVKHLIDFQVSAPKEIIKFKTTRHSKAAEFGTIFLDFTSYPDGESDCEIEYEIFDFSQLNNAINELNTKGVSFTTQAKPKIARAVNPKFRKLSHFEHSE